MSVEILVPLDGSDTAEHALAPAVAVAKRANGMLHLCRVCPPPPEGEGSDRATAREQWQRECVRALIYLRVIRERLAATFGVRVGTSIRSGAPAESILREAELIGAELIVLTTHGQRESGARWIGSTADEVVHCADCPVLLLPPKRGPVDWSSGIYFRVLVPVDDPAAIAAVQAGTPVIPGGRRVICCLLPLAAKRGQLVDEGDIGAEADRGTRAGRLLQTLAALIAETGRRTLSLSQDDGSPAAAILTAAREYDADLIAIGLPPKLDRSPARFARPVEQLLLMAPLPLLLQRPVARRPLTLAGLELPSPDDHAAGAAS